MKKILRSMMPPRLWRAIRKYRDSIALGRIATLSCDAAALCLHSDVIPAQILTNAVRTYEWDEVEHALEPFAIPDGTGGVNPGDRRAIYYLLRQLGPTSILEIGTHIGASTVYAASALARNEVPYGATKTLVSVDIADVNDPVGKPWLQHGTKYSPRVMIEKLGFGRFVEFVTRTSIDHLAAGETYDFIFLDGDHAARTVYQEVPAALQALNPGGVILLHDYFPGLGSLWPKGDVISGPFLAMARLEAEGANVIVVPLGDLPWPTKLGSNTTSLALLLKQDP